MPTRATVIEDSRRADVSGWKFQILPGYAGLRGIVSSTAPQHAGLIGLAKDLYAQFALIRRVLRQTISFLALLIDNLTCVFHRPMALAAVLLFRNRTRCRICRLRIWFLARQGARHEYKNVNALRLCCWTAFDHDGSPGANHLLRQWELRR